MIEINLDEDLQLINYIKEQLKKGFSRDHIRDKLLSIGWDRKRIDKYLNEYVLEKETDEVETFAEYGKFLLDKEEIQSKLRIGLNSILITTKGIIIAKRFPRHITKLTFKDIELIEFFRSIHWKDPFYMIVYSLLLYWFNRFYDYIWELFQELFPKFITTIANFPITTEINLFKATIIGIFGYFILNRAYDFIMSSIGTLRILPHNEGPHDIITLLTPEVQDVIKTIEKHHK